MAAIELVFCSMTRVLPSNDLEDEIKRNTGCSGVLQCSSKAYIGTNTSCAEILDVAWSGLCKQNLFPLVLVSIVIRIIATLETTR